MRKLMSLMLVISGLTIGCDSDDGDTKTTMDPAMATGGENNSTGNGNGGATGGSSGSSDGIDIPDAASGGGELYPECPRDQIPAEFPGYEGEVTFTMEQFQACQEMCGQNNDCYNETNCPGIDAFDECANTEIIGCTGSATGGCREEYENLVCCGNEFQCDPSDAECVQTNCAPEIMSIQTCLQSDTPCIQSALSACLATAPAEMPGAGGNGMTNAISMPALIQHAFQQVRALR